MKNKMYYLFVLAVVGITLLIFGIEVFHNKGIERLELHKPSEDKKE